MFEHYKFEYDKNDLELKNDKNYVLNLVKKLGWALKFASN